MEAEKESRGRAPARVHAFADCLVAAVLLADPWLFGFADDTTTGAWISVLAGAGLVVLNAATAYEGGIVRRVIPMRAHLVADGLLGLFSIVSARTAGACGCSTIDETVTVAVSTQPTSPVQCDSRTPSPDT
jgi:hypothetical protein